MPLVGKTYSPEILNQVTKPSAQSRKHSAIINKTDLVNSWRKSIIAEQIERAVEILSLFGLQKIYNDGDMPLISGTDALNAFSAEREI